MPLILGNQNLGSPRWFTRFNDLVLQQLIYFLTDETTVFLREAPRFYRYWVAISCLKSLGGFTKVGVTELILRGGLDPPKTTCKLECCPRKS